MDETTPAASSTSRSIESPSPPVSELFFFNYSFFKESGLTLFIGEFQTVMGKIANGCSTALPKGPFVFVAPKRGYELKILGTSAGGDISCSGFWTGVDEEEEDTPNFETLAKAGRSFSVEPGVFSFTLWGFRDSVSY